MKLLLHKLFRIIFIFLVFSCKSKVDVPKPYGYIGVDFPEQDYQKYCPYKFPFCFEVSKAATIKRDEKSYLDIFYKDLNATFYITAHKASKNNLDVLLADAEKITQKHTLKASYISSKTYQNIEKNIYATIFQVEGDAASSLQFYITDSISSVITGSLYFDAVPNYDSLSPSIEYLKRDMLKFVESVEKNAKISLE